MVNFIKINKESLKPIKEQLLTKYPYLRREKNHFEGIFSSWICSDKHLPTNSLLEYLANITQYCNKNDIIDINIALDKGLPAINKKRIVNNVSTILKHDLNDYPLIKYAVDFYGKSLEEFGNDIMLIAAINSNSVYHKIKHENLKKQFAHIFKCAIMLILGILFYYLKIATIIEDVYSHNHSTISKLMAKYTANGKNFDIDKIKKKSSIKDFMNKLIEKNGTSSTYYIDFYVDRLRSIYDMYDEPMRQINKIKSDQYLKYLQQFPDYKQFFESNENGPLYGNLSNLKHFMMDNYFYLIPIYYQFGNKFEDFENDATRHFVKPKIFDFDETQLLIEV
ncbi:putative ORFan [Tupanvirus deep ocean]|uniref:ORFan n=2 Tax=Tupanvirus TaxID=2094720 RepID=A0AC62A9H2_9VIRU|nr:putative ORFan [Tupanvirus deep ocean]QKU34323.1 putative ORFan [Tupanvirus deep ocean]